MNNDGATLTPGGIPSRCPICGELAVVLPSFPAGDAPCPRCGCLMWPEPPRPRPTSRRSIAPKTPRSFVIPLSAFIPGSNKPQQPPSPGGAYQGRALVDLMGELTELRRRIADAEADRRGVGRLGSFLAAVLRRLRWVFRTRKPRPRVLDASGVSDRWID